MDTISVELGVQREWEQFPGCEEQRKGRCQKKQVPAGTRERWEVADRKGGEERGNDCRQPVALRAGYVYQHSFPACYGKQLGIRLFHRPVLLLRHPPPFGEIACGLTPAITPAPCIYVPLSVVTALVAVEASVNVEDRDLTGRRAP
ncbi:hypothetical protein MRX96_039447 [Rhipicephalus microplus]